ncbi:glutamate carboxypeptidase [Variovorax sp. J22R133]|uniref:glutamate carboxypeptidase n=1 Tax=Variovorax brevis TaxID=3053503 RepID=UPI002578B162|nr:glutamate carboxypeptidase [Variovorax sp. J22R133]MDM0113510.1 glutamate carboxypeptidase [Variovorax sp. J22R133]
MTRSITPLLSSLAIAAALAFATTAAHAAPDARLLAAAEKAQPALIDSLKEMVLVESGSLNSEGLLKMADITDGRLKALGFKTQRVKTTSGAPAEIVVGTLKGTGKRKLMLQAHMDTVYPAGILNTQGYRVDGNRIYGPGIADDKGGIAVMLASLKILIDSGWKDFDTITVLFNTDEEVGSGASGELIATTAEKHDFVMSFEPTYAKSVTKGEPLLLGAAGTAQATMDVKGKASHAGAAPEQGRNALYELSYQLLQTRDLSKDIPGVALNWTVATATGPINQITEKAQALGDVRITQPGAEKKLDAALQAKVASGKLIPDSETTVTLDVKRPAFLAGDKGLAVAKKAQEIYKEIDRELALVPMTGGGTDAGFAGRSGKPGVVESFGLSGFGYHAKDEFIEVDSIVPRIYLVTRLMTELAK